MTKKAEKAERTEGEKIAALTLVALDRIAGSLHAIQETLASPKKTRWYEASWRSPTDQYNGHLVSQMRHRVAVEAFDAVEARTTLNVQLKGYQGQVTPRVSGGEDGIVAHLQDFQLRPLGEHQCKYCCSTNWAEDGERCNICSRTPQESILLRRTGQFHTRPANSYEW